MGLLGAIVIDNADDLDNLVDCTAAGHGFDLQT